MKSIDAWVIRQHIPVKGEADEAAAKAVGAAFVEHVTLTPISPFEGGFSGFMDQHGDRVGGNIFFSKQDADAVLLQAAAPVRRRIEAEIEALSRITGGQS
jgi:hypothetical protein